MQRTAIQLAHNTIVVSLPAKWVKANNIQKGDEFEVTEAGREIILSPPKARNPKKKIINLTEWKVLHRRLLLSAYLQGFDEVEILFQDPKTQRIEEVKELVSIELLGFEIIKQTPTSVIIKDISAPATESFDTIFKRIFMMIDDVSQEFLHTLKNETNDFSHIITMDRPMNRFCNYATRILYKTGYPNYKRTPIFYSTILILEHLGDSYKEFAKKIMNKEIKVQKEDIKNFEKIHNLFRYFQTTYLFYDKEKMHIFIRAYEDTKKNLQNTYSPFAFYLRQILEYIIIMNNNLLMMI